MGAATPRPLRSRKARTRCARSVRHVLGEAAPSAEGASFRPCWRWAGFGNSDPQVGATCAGRLGVGEARDACPSPTDRVPPAIPQEKVQSVAEAMPARRKAAARRPPNAGQCRKRPEKARPRPRCPTRPARAQPRAAAHATIRPCAKVGKAGDQGPPHRCELPPRAQEANPRMVRRCQ